MTQPYHDNMFMNSTGNSFYLSSESSKMTLWMGDLEPWMDEHFLRQLWTSMGENVVVKLIRDKRTGLGYAFIGFSSTTAAQRALATIHGTKMPNSQRAFRLNWASGGGILDKKEDRAPEYSLFVGDLSSDVDETYLLAVFRQRYPSCHSAKVMTDPISGASRGYGFVRFHDQQEQQDALIKMNGVYCGHRPVRISLATPKSTSHARYYQLALQAPALIQQPTDPSNTTVFVGGLSTPIHEDELRLYFSPFGEVTYVKIPPGKGCGFVQYVSRASAELAIEKMNGFQIGQSRIRLSWGRSQNDKQPPTSTLLHPSISSSSSSSSNNNNMNDMNDPAFFLNSPPPPPSISHLPTMSQQQQSIMSLGDTYYMNQQWQQQQQQQQQSSHHHHLLQQQQSSSSPPPLSHSFQHHDSLHHPSISSTMATSSSSSAPLLIDTKSSPFLRNSTTVYDPNIMLSPVSSTTGNPSTTSTPYSMVINNNNINASSPGLQSFQSLSPPSSGRFPLRFSQQDDSKIMEFENKIYSSTTTTSSTITPIPSSSSTTTTTNHTTLSPPVHFINHRPEWISPSNSSSIITNNNSNSMNNNMNYSHHHFNNNGNNGNNNNNNNSDSLSNLNTSSSDHDPSNQHWRRLGGIYA
ncbi:unnamed protein product [Cunninghamella echinulata]